MDIKVLVLVFLWVTKKGFVYFIPGSNGLVDRVMCFIEKILITFKMDLLFVIVSMVIDCKLLTNDIRSTVCDILNRVK